MANKRKLTKFPVQVKLAIVADAIVELMEIGGVSKNSFRKLYGMSNDTVNSYRFGKTSHFLSI